MPTRQSKPYGHLDIDSLMTERQSALRLYPTNFPES